MICCKHQQGNVPNCQCHCILSRYHLWLYDFNLRKASKLSILVSINCGVCVQTFTLLNHEVPLVAKLSGQYLLWKCCYKIGWWDHMEKTFLSFTVKLHIAWAYQLWTVIHLEFQLQLFILKTIKYSINMERWLKDSNLR